jgi:hypothetical protein
MGTIAQRAELHFMVTQLNAIRLKRNNSKSKKRKAFLNKLIDVGELELEAKSKKYGEEYGTKRIDWAALRAKSKK